MKLLPFLLLLSLGINAQDKPDTLTASQPEKILFSLNYRRMHECCTAVLVQRKELAVKDTLLQVYQQETGIYQQNAKLAKESFDRKKSINGECVPQLIDCQKQLDIYRHRSRRRVFVIGFGIPIGMLAGYGAGRFVQSLK